MKLKQLVVGILWILALVIGVGFIRAKCTNRYYQFKQNVNRPVNSVRTVSLSEAMRKKMVDVTVTYADNRRNAQITVVRKTEAPCYIRLNQGNLSLTQTNPAVTVRVDSELRLNLSDNSLASVKLPVVK